MAKQKETDFIKDLKEEPKIRVRIPKRYDDDNDYEVVGINAHYYQIKRGETVEIPQSVALILEQSGLI